MMQRFWEKYKKNTFGTSFFPNNKSFFLIIFLEVCEKW